MASAAAEDAMRQAGGARTPTAGHKRGREQQPKPDQPCSALLEQIRRLKLPAVDAATANRLLGPFVREALKFDERSTLLGIVQQFGWVASAAPAPPPSAAGSAGVVGGEFSRSIDLGSFSLLLQKYRYERLQELGSGSYAVVYKARNRETDEVIALKKLRFGFDEQGLPSSTLREISLLKELKHANIVELKDIIYGFGTNNVYVVLECLDCDLRHLLDAEQELEMRKIKAFLHQILLAVNHAHMHCVMHRDLKPQNILVDASHNNVKVADFGLARSFLPPFKAYTDKVVTLWYRAPELLLGVNSYSTGIDMWSVGCIFAEMLTREPLFRAESEIGLLHKIFEALGTPNDSVWAGVERLAHYRSNYPQWQPKDWGVLVPRLAGDALGINLLASMLTYDPEARISAAQALKHPWFDDLAASHMPSSSQAAAAAAGIGPSAAPAFGGSRLAPAQQGAPAGFGGSRLAPAQQGPSGPPHMQQQQAADRLHGLQQQQQHMQAHMAQMQQPHAHLQQLQLQHMQQPAPQYPQHVAPAPPQGPGMQGGCRSNQAWVSQRPAQQPAAPAGVGHPTPA